MDSIKELFKIGYGPSSSHTMGPRKASEIFLGRNKNAGSFRITLYGSLAATGKGHLTDQAILSVLQPVAPTQIIFEPSIELPFHPNGMKFEALDATGKKTNEWTTYSIGGGTLSDGNKQENASKQSLYNFHTIEEIKKWCEKNGSAYWEYVEQNEGSDIWDYMKEIWDVMRDSVTRGLEKEGVLPGGLGLRRKASDYLIKAKGYDGSLKNRGMVYAYALAVSEENASGGKIVTAPTCGGSGVLPAVLYYLHKKHDFRETRILKALATAGLFGNVVKHNASISGAEVGCQGEVGVACAMASAASCQLFGGSVAQIEYAAEMGLEHHLGLTCDPVCGMVQIPCIERNAFAAARALDSNIFATFSDGRHRVSFDHVVEVMKQTGHDLPSVYKETSEGGLAKMYKHGSSLGC